MTIGELLIRGGKIIDPARNFYDEADILIHRGKIVAIHADEKIEAERTIDATGYLVLPGLIDYHTHLFHSGTSFSVHPDTAMLPQGVTTAVDQGSAGVTNFESFYKTVVTGSIMRIFAHLHVSPGGLSTLTRCLEPVGPKLFDEEKALRLLETYSGCLVGLKIRQSKEIVGELGVEPLGATIRMAEKLRCRVAVHTTNPPGEVEEILSLLRPDDVYTHMYQGKGCHILNESNKVRPSVWQARDKGILFDTADGRGHYAFSVAKGALADGFLPDVISTDLVGGSLYDQSVFGLPLIMTKYLALGMSLNDVVKACTATPARILGMVGKIGTLQAGAYGDVAIFELKQMQIPLHDVFGKQVTCREVLIPRATVLGGKVVYRSLEF